ncbi:hypothetical protein SSP24_39100 [Streptomyces spinoverrucosus]|uniref:Aminoglycoside phosphotransferase domain-containing protein n=1 Tax=Streptomyces spinoverrucosus TaxID=284043 RepID=A0A4Y3VJB7_9ACTN|nr:hypothetical protein [Streptomyces spinoverrucosus]GEC06255.1 hypothetical protein SSP24_39100 [Streptomyces spinoverrucosus]GHB75710.1 hypothetical protein GCM10010397_52670 [Streptomyces spinoverrucosus]
MSAVAEFATGLQVTRVRRTPDGRYEWWQGPGASASAPPAAPLAPYVPRHTSGADLVVPRASGGGLAHLADGPYSAAAWLRDPRPAVRQLVAHALAAAGTALRELHAVPVPDTAGVPPALTRLRAFLDGDGTPAPALARLREHAVRAWGPARVERLRSWCDDLAGPGGTVLVHGFASLGALIPPLHRGPVALLTGEDLGAARPELDLGWLLGDLAELGWAVPGSEAFGGPDLPRVLLDAYGPGADREPAGRAAVVRIAAHMRDFAAYCDWSDELTDYTAFIADLIDEEGRRAVPGGATP